MPETSGLSPKGNGLKVRQKPRSDDLKQLAQSTPQLLDLGSGAEAVGERWTSMPQTLGEAGVMAAKARDAAARRGVISKLEPGARRMVSFDGQGRLVIPHGLRFITMGAESKLMFAISEGSAIARTADGTEYQRVPGDVLGEIGLLLRKKRTADVSASSVEGAKVWVFDRKDYEKWVMEANLPLHRHLLETISIRMGNESVFEPVFRSIAQERGADSLSHLRQYFRGFEGIVEDDGIVRIPPGKVFIKKNQKPAVVYLIKEGDAEVRLILDEGLRTFRRASGELVGEMSVVEQRPASASVVSGEKGLTALVATSEEYERHIKGDRVLSDTMKMTIAERKEAWPETGGIRRINVDREMRPVVDFIFKSDNLRGRILKAAGIGGIEDSGNMEVQYAGQGSQKNVYMVLTRITPKEGEPSTIALRFYKKSDLITNADDSARGEFVWSKFVRQKGFDAIRLFEYIRSNDPALAEAGDLFQRAGIACFTVGEFIPMDMMSQTSSATGIKIEHYPALASYVTQIFLKSYVKTGVERMQTCIDLAKLNREAGPSEAGGKGLLSKILLNRVSILDGGFCIDDLKPNNFIIRNRPVGRSMTCIDLGLHSWGSFDVLLKNLLAFTEMEIGSAKRLDASRAKDVFEGMRDGFRQHIERNIIGAGAASDRKKALGNLEEMVNECGYKDREKWAYLKCGIAMKEVLGEVEQDIQARIRSMPSQ